jgi:hypothetical protein
MIKLIINLLSALALFIYLGLAQPGIADAEVGININIAPPPFFAFPAPPEVLVIPGAYVYFVPDIDVDVFFYGGYWYRPYKEYWYRSRSYNGPWAHIDRKRMPPVILNVPPDFRHRPPGHNRIPYKELKRNWKGWEKNRHWDKDRGNSKGRGRGKHR